MATRGKIEYKTQNANISDHKPKASERSLTYGGQGIIFAADHAEVEAVDVPTPGQQLSHPGGCRSISPWSLKLC